MKSNKGNAKSRADKRADRRRRLVAIIVGAFAILLALAMILAYVPGITACSAQTASSLVDGSPLTRFLPVGAAVHATPESHASLPYCPS